MSRVQHRDYRRRRNCNSICSPTSNVSAIGPIVPATTENVPQSQPTYRFYCQLAHGSPTGIIHGFRTVRELYVKIAECFDLNVSDIMYCTLNTHKLDVDKVLGHEIGLNDFIFAHIRGQPKEIAVRKECESFGMTLTDTGCGVVFIKRIQPGGMMAYASECCGGKIEIGDQIERINSVSFVGRRHYEVAAYLKNIPLGATFLLRIISPERSPIYMLNTRASMSGHSSILFNGKRTLRLQANGILEERTVMETEMDNLRHINQVLGSYLGFEDDELAFLTYSLAKQSATPFDLTMALNRQQLVFYLPPEVIYQLWMVVHQSQHYTLSAMNTQQHYARPTRMKRRI
ncbi:RGS-GAIP interacting protein GIPC [Paragonimus heterotremus]|uniref:RGS-GAIP interacting protein GIPC n=1 Tax=Paragonimus heterotremus TaxID=100268 RepID=A0A8J4WJF3_9TREM|nr:RGS-GAIP interacting protein GIPC [Paragonimus heterotremus]